MSIPIRIMNDGVKEIRVTQVDANDLPVNSYRIPAGQMSPTFDAEGVTLFSGHAFVVTDNPEHVARNPMEHRTDPSELAIPEDDEQEETKA